MLPVPLNILLLPFYIPHYICLDKYGISVAGTISGRVLRWVVWFGILKNIYSLIWTYVAAVGRLICVLPRTIVTVVYSPLLVWKRRGSPFWKVIMLQVMLVILCPFMFLWDACVGCFMSMETLIRVRAGKKEGSITSAKVYFVDLPELRELQEEQEKQNRMPQQLPEGSPPQGDEDGKLGL